MTAPLPSDLHSVAVDDPGECERAMEAGEFAELSGVGVEVRTKRESAKEPT